uniref:Uncharacterized protein n=1 Tax=Moniliophthora roreri TaxID=221103 RepID=A0A0W0FXC0_MONRR
MSHFPSVWAAGQSLAAGQARPASGAGVSF